MAITMNLVSEFVLERLLPSGVQHAVFPSVLDPLGPVNMRHSSSHLRPVHVPGSDVMKAAKGAGSLQIISGDSNVVATLEPASYDGVVSVFYLDACGSLLAAIDAAWQALVAGGVWVSLGPLEYNQWRRRRGRHMPMATWVMACASAATSCCGLWVHAASR